MKDQNKTKKELIAENKRLRQRIQELEQTLAGDRTSLDLSATCRNGLAVLRGSTPEPVALDADLPSPGPPAQANARQLRQISEATCTTEDRPGGTILLVDDDDIIVNITGMMLVRLGFTVLSAGDGKQAVEIFRQHQDEICLVLSDVFMPRMNGWETLSALRRIDPDVAVILISGYGEEQIMEGNHPDLPQAFLEKPYSFEVLKDALRRALRDTAKYASCRGLLDPSGA
jgi:CheY-like chemotaxis protein